MLLKMGSLLLGLLLVIVVIAPSLGSPVIEEEYEDYQGDGDYYNDEGDYYNELNGSETQERKIMRNPKFVSTSKTLMVNEGDTIKLPCIVDKLEGFVLIWKKADSANGEQIIAVGDSIIDKDDSRVQLEGKKNGNELVISLAEVKDAGEYMCQVSSFNPTQIKHDVKIRVAPEVVPVPNSGVITVEAGQPASLGCDIVKGSPEPDITWRRKDRPMPSGERSVSALSLSYPKTDRHHSGIYICSADNGWGRPVTAMIRLDVQHAPEIEQEQTFIHTKEGDETEVTCIVHSSPHSNVTWYKNGQLLNEKVNVITQRGNRHTLLITELSGSTHGKYACRAVNKLGEDMKMTEVSGKATPAEFKSNPKGKEKRAYTLTWVVESITAVTEFQVEYRKSQEDDEWKILTSKPKRVDTRFYEGEVIIENLKPSTMYLARVKAKNSFGYSDFSPNYNFITSTAPKHTTSTNKKEPKDNKNNKDTTTKVNDSVVQLPIVDPDNSSVSRVIFSPVGLLLSFAAAIFCV